MGVRYPQEIIEDIHQTADIVEIVSESVPLKKAGRDYVGLCPFHTEKTPSFTVSPSKRMFYCFGCGTGGNTVTFIQKQFHLSFPEALNLLAARYGIELPNRPLSDEEQSQARERESLYHINRQAMEYFQKVLHQPEGRVGWEYLMRRQMTKDMIHDFQLGFAPEAWSRVVELFSAARVDLARVENAGLIIQRSGGNGYYDRFRNRIIFPILDTRMQVAGFGGRVMDDSTPKYLNSPETPIYHKGKMLYGMHRTGRYIRETGIVHLVEGYFDCLALYRHGVQNVAATLGTALTPDHLRLLKAYAKSVILVFDSDQAGVKAAKRSIDIFKQEHVDARILILPQGHDPDSFVNEFGADAFRQAAQKALSAISFLMDLSIQQNGLSLEGKARVAAEMLAPIAAIPDKILQTLYIKELCERICVDEAIIIEQFHQQQSRQPVSSAKSAIPQAPKPLDKQPPKLTPSSKIEHKIIAMMIQFPEILDEVRNRKIIAFFHDPLLKSIGETVLNRWNGTDGGLSNILSMLKHEKEQSITASLAMGEDVWNREGCLRLLEQFTSVKSERMFREKKHQVQDQDLLLEVSNRILMQARERQSII